MCTEFVLIFQLQFGLLSVVCLSLLSLRGHRTKKCVSTLNKEHS